MTESFRQTSEGRRQNHRRVISCVWVCHGPATFYKRQAAAPESFHSNGRGEHTKVNIEPALTSQIRYLTKMALRTMYNLPASWVKNLPGIFCQTQKPETCWEPFRQTANNLLSGGRYNATHITTGSSIICSLVVSAYQPLYGICNPSFMNTRILCRLSIWGFMYVG